MANRLANETSAYLRQHAHNPVDWYPWGDEAWNRARAEDKPVLVSIGYSSCHWCHVMERESFEDPNVGRLMNEHVVAIKVDREERPDVDQIYMEAVQRMTGSGGWPLNMFCMPDGRPFMGGTYFPPRRMHNRPSFAEVVLAVSRLWTTQRDDVQKAAQEVLASLHARPDVTAPDPLGRESLSVLVRQLMARADRRHGGFGAAPKFPTATNLEAVLAATQLGVARGDSLEHLVFSLEKMARGGIFDQLGGGFHRYSTDERWLVPHFEKMLYDNGQLLRVYANAYRLTADEELRWPVAETAAWLEREMLGPRSEAYASQDADSEGEEGRYFVWSPDEIEAVLGPEDAVAFCAAYGVSAQGNFEGTGKCVLSQARDVERSVW
ncbi:MAG: thioredoxin domain-containing protein, partial [Myxococcota bacterium]